MAGVSSASADDLVVAADAFFFSRVAQFVVLAVRHAIPTLHSRREFPAAGGFLSYGPNINDSYRLLGVYAARILKGEKPGDLLIITLAARHKLPAVYPFRDMVTAFG